MTVKKPTREDKIGLNNEVRFREEMIKLDREIFQFKGGVNQAYRTTKEIYSIHSMLSSKIKNNQSKILNMKKMMREYDEMDTELEQERRARDLMKEQLNKEEVELANEQDILDMVKHESEMKNNVGDLEKDRDQARGWVQYMLNFDNRFSKCSTRQFSTAFQACFYLERKGLFRLVFTVF